MYTFRSKVNQIRMTQRPENCLNNKILDAWWLQLALWFPS